MKVSGEMVDFVSPRVRKNLAPESSYLNNLRMNAEPQHLQRRRVTRRALKRIFRPFFAVFRGYLLRDAMPLLLAINGRVHADSERLDSMEREIVSLNLQIAKNAAEFDEIIRILRTDYKDPHGI